MHGCYLSLSPGYGYDCLCHVVRPQNVIKHSEATVMLLDAGGAVLTRIWWVWECTCLCVVCGGVSVGAVHLSGWWPMP